MSVMKTRCLGRPVGGPSLTRTESAGVTERAVSERICLPVSVAAAASAVPLYLLSALAADRRPGAVLCANRGCCCPAALWCRRRHVVLSPPCGAVAALWCCRRPVVLSPPSGAVAALWCRRRPVLQSPPCGAVAARCRDFCQRERRGGLVFFLMPLLT